MKTLIALIISVFALCSAALSAVVVTDITKAEFDSVASDTTAMSWTAYLQAGGASEVVYESILTKPGSPPDNKNHTWSADGVENFSVAYDASGNLTQTVGSTVHVFQPVKGFDAFVLQLQDFSPLDGGSSFQNITVNGVTVRNMFADGGGNSRAYDQIRVEGLGTTFSISGTVRKGDLTFGDEFYIKTVGYMIPEPASAGLVTLSVILVFFRRRR